MLKTSLLLEDAVQEIYQKLWTVLFQTHQNSKINKLKIRLRK
jgi:hypothetical protein